MLKQNLIKDLLPSENFHGTLLVKSISHGLTKSKKPFASIFLQDPSGQINGKLWDTTPTDLEFKAGDIVEIHARVENFRNECQFQFESVDPIDQDDPRNKVELYLQYAPIPSDEMNGMFDRFLNYIQSNNPNYALIARKILAKTPYDNTFLTQPAAKAMHHTFVGGLAYHTYRMVQHAYTLTNLYPSLNGPLLCTATLIHDAGKMMELSGYLDTDYTAYGNLVGHILIVSDWIHEICINHQINPYQEDIVLLKHCILAHHGILEHGSPTTPKIPEAYALHNIDLLDARMTSFEEELQNIAPGAQSGRLFNLDNNPIYHASDNNRSFLDKDLDETKLN